VAEGNVEQAASKKAKAIAKRNAPKSKKEEAFAI
jgi:hypothetical protein